MLLTVNNFPETVVTTSIYRWHTLILGTLLERVLRDRESTLDTAYSKFFYPLKDFSPNTKCVIAGSIRREKPQVHDIDLLVVSKEKEIIDYLEQNNLVPAGKYNLAVSFAVGYPSKVELWKKEVHEKDWKGVFKIT